MSSDSEERYQIATLIVATTTGLVIFFYLLIFLNPFIAINPFKPIRPTPTLIVVLVGLPATWTPTNVPSSPTPAFTPTPFPSATLVIPPTPTQVPVTATPPPTITPSPTPRPTRTLAPTAVPVSAAPTSPPSPYAYRTVFNCSHSGGTQIKGTVASGNQPQYGVRVRVATSPDAATVVEEQYTRQQPDGSAGYAFVFKPIGAFDTPTTWYIWVTDGTGTPISNPNFHFQTNNFSQDNPLACWLAIIDFVK